MEVSEEIVSALIEQHESWLRRVLMHRLGNRDAVDDVFQEVSLALSNCQQVPVSVPAWLYRVAVRQAFLAQRRLSRFRNLINGVATRTGCSAKSTDPLSWLLIQERQAAVRTAFGRLSVVDRDILMLKYAEGWTYKELAERLSVSVHTIEHRLLRAKSRLRERLAELDVEVSQ